MRRERKSASFREALEHLEGLAKRVSNDLTNPSRSDRAARISKASEGRGDSSL